MAEFWAFVTGAGIAPYWFVASVGNILYAICAGMIVFAVGYALWFLFTHKHTFREAAINLLTMSSIVFIFAFISTAHENKFLKCEKVLDATKDSIYSCHMRKTENDPWSAKAAIVDFSMPHQKYDQSRYQ